MNVYEFENEKGEVHPVSTAKPSILLDGIKLHLNKQKCARSVDNWNVLREEIKARFGRAAVSELDASGYITEWLKQKPETR